MTQAPRGRAQFSAEAGEGGRFVRQVSRFRDWVRADLGHITRHPSVTHDAINPTGIVPKGPELDLTKPSGRG